MKSIKLLMAAFAISAMFASCAKQEVVEQQNAEFVGAKLLGTNISVNFNKDSQTKLTGTAWESTDQLGMAWYIEGNDVGAEQKKLESDNPRLYANHLFQKGSENGRFTTKGNVYEGWHFVYYPYAYEKRIGQIKKVVINPKQTELWEKDRYNSCLYVSAREFFTEGHLDANNQLEVGIDVFRALGTIGITLNPSTMFTGSDALKNLKINALTIKTEGVTTFVPEAELHPNELAKFQYKTVGEQEVYDKAATQAAVYASLNKGSRALHHTAVSETVTTEVENDAIDLSAPQTLRVFTYPSPANFTADKVTFTIEVDGGVFTIGYTNKPDAQLTDAQRANNKAINDLVAAYKAGGALADYKESVKESILYLSLELTAADFAEDFTDIDCETKWDNAVAVANALNRQNVEFTITKTKATTPYAWAFEKLDANNDLITLPNGELNVIGEGIIIGANGEWPADGITANNVTVKNGVTLTVADNVVLDSDVDNNGIISVGKKAKVKGVNNADGRINVVYGSYLELAGSDYGTIAYNVTGKDKAYQINYLTQAGNALGDATVNTLVVDGKTFDLSMVDEDIENNDPYNGSVTPGQSLKNMNLISFELNNGILKADANSGVAVKEVEVLGGTKNAIWNTNVNENLTITAGKVVIDAESVGTYKESIKVQGEIDNKGELLANTTVYTSVIKNPKGSKTTVADNETVWYTTTYQQGGTATGNISKLENLPGVFVTETVAVETGDMATVGVDNKDKVVAKISAAEPGSTIILPAGNYYFDSENEVNNIFLNGAKSLTIQGEAGTVIKVNNKGLKFGRQAEKVEVTLKNLSIDANGSYAIYAGANCIVNLQNVNITNTGGMSILIENISGGSNGNKTVVNAYNVNVPATADKHIQMFTYYKGYGGLNWKSYAYFNYEGGNITDSMLAPQSGAKSTGDNMFVNGVALPASM